LAQLGSARRTIAVLGDMLELGPESPRWHREVGAHLASRGVTALIACGPGGQQLAEGAETAGMPSDHVHRVEHAQAAGEVLAYLAMPGDVVLLKASRGMRLEQAILPLRVRLARTTVG
jgi:UDP-N-acetylmuramoyl-tripeptide--D-alanyl-D-alanine ligase